MPPLSEDEKFKRDEYVKRYLLTHDAYRACILMGYTQMAAQEWSERYKNCPYVQKRLLELEGHNPKLREMKLDDDELIYRKLVDAIKNGSHRDGLMAVKLLMEFKNQQSGTSTATELSEAFSDFAKKVAKL